MAIQFAFRARPFDLLDLMRLKLTGRNVHRSETWAIEPHSDFGSSWRGAASIWSELHTPAGPGRKEHRAATTAARAAS
jgi:hypothetical protein